MSNQRRENNASIQNKKRKRSDKRTRQLNKGDRKRAKRMSEEDAGLVVSADQLEWQKISLQNDEFDDFEEIEGVDVDYVDKDGSKVIQFKVVNKRKQMGKPMVAKAVKTREETTSEEEWGGIVDSERNSLAEEEAERAQNPIENLEVWQTDVDLPGWSKLSLSQPTLQALNALGFAAPTEIQSLAIPRIMQGHDLIGKASTGSGKTLAFGIPILEHILSLPDPKTSSPSALVIAPTRELAKQIVAHLQDIAKFAAGAMTIVNVTGGLAVQKQIRLLEKRPSVIVGTPGRLWELFDNAQDVKNLDLSSAMKVIKFLVLDEADRLLQEGHFSEIEKILDFVNSGEGKQTLVFSATFQKQLQQKLKGKKSFEGNLLSKDDALEFLLHKLKFREQPPRYVDANPDTAVTTQVHEGIVECTSLEKDLFLYYFLLKYPGRTLVFVNSIDAVRRIVPLLTNLRLPAIALHSQLIQKQRIQALERFKSSPKSILVATDIAARGLDISNVQHVVHYHLPRATDTYIHRSGRTARGVEEGVSLLICAPDEQKPLRQMLTKLDKTKYLNKMLDAFPIDRLQVARLKHRVDTAQKIVKASRQVQRQGYEEKWLAEAADDLGVDVDEMEQVINSKGKSGKQQVDKVSKGQVQGWKAELEDLLSQPLMSGFSARYLTSGSINHADRLVNGDAHEAFLGMDASSALEDFRSNKKSKKSK